MPYQNQVRPLNLFGDFVSGQNTAIDQQGALQGNALRNLQVQRQTGLNALAQDPTATPEQYVRAGDTAGGMALDTMNQRGQVDKQQAVSQLAGIAQKALTITDPAQRKGFLQQAGQIYGPAFQALGADMSQFPAMLAMPDDQLAQKLQQVAQFAAPQKPIEVAAGTSVLQPQADGSVKPLYTAPNPGQDETARHNRAMEDRANPGQVITRPVSDGMVQDFLLDTRTGKRTPNGAPYSAAEAKGQSGLGAREGVMFQRVVNSANSAATALQNIAELPVGASSGVLGVGGGPGHSVMSSVKSMMMNKLASQDVQDYNTMLAGVSRNLSTIETAGLAPNGSITNSMDSIQLREGDTELTKLRKLAEMRQIVEKGIEPNLSNPKLPPEQKDLVRTIVNQVKAAIPFTQHDITELRYKQSKDSAFTLQDLITQKGLRPAGTAPPTEGGAAAATAPVRVNSPQEAMALAPGTVFITPDGRQKVR